MLTVSIPDEIDLQLSSVTNDKKKFIIAAIRQKIALQKKALFPEQLAKEYSDSRIENNQITKDFANADKENWNDYSSFIQHAGIPALNLGFGGEGEGGEYHSIFDSYYDFITFKDPGFKYEVALAQTAGRAVLRMANADVLPFDFTHLYKTIEGYSSELQSLLQSTRESTEIENQMIHSNYYAIGEDPTKKLIAPVAKPEVPYLDFSPLQNALVDLKKSADSLKVIFQNKISAGNVSVAFNQSLYQAEQQLLSETGLPRRPWYRHTIYAPGFYTGYGVKTMPGIREAIEQREWKEAQEQIFIDAKAITKLADYLKDTESK